MSGDAALVPQTPNHPPSYESYSATPGEQPASADTSESVRYVQLGSCCHEGFVTPAPLPLFEQPPPAPFHAVSLYVEPLLASCVPPTETTLARDSGLPFSL